MQELKLQLADILVNINNRSNPYSIVKQGILDKLDKGSLLPSKYHELKRAV